MRYAAIRRHRDEYPIQLMRRCLWVSRSGYHAWAGRAPSARIHDNQRLLERIRQIHTKGDGVIGMPCMHERTAGVRGRTGQPQPGSPVDGVGWPVRGAPAPPLAAQADRRAAAA